MSRIYGLRGLQPAVKVERSARAQALDELQTYDWWRQAMAESGENVTDACLAVLRERSDDPLIALAFCELERRSR